jgi:hypothetical protein
MPIINLIMFLASIGSIIGLRLSGHSDPALESMLTALAGGSMGAHAGATIPALGGAK